MMELLAQQPISELRFDEYFDDGNKADVTSKDKWMEARDGALLIHTKKESGTETISYKMGFDPFDELHGGADQHELTVRGFQQDYNDSDGVVYISGKKFLVYQIRSSKYNMVGLAFVTRGPSGDLVYFQLSMDGSADEKAFLRRIWTSNVDQRSHHIDTGLTATDFFPDYLKKLKIRVAPGVQAKFVLFNREEATVYGNFEIRVDKEKNHFTSHLKIVEQQFIGDSKPSIARRFFNPNHVSYREQSSRLNPKKLKKNEIDILAKLAMEDIPVYKPDKTKTFFENLPKGLIPGKDIWVEHVDSFGDRIRYVVSKMRQGAIIHKYNFTKEGHTIAFIHHNDSYRVETLFDPNTSDKSKILLLIYEPYYRIKDIKGNPNSVIVTHDELMIPVVMESHEDVLRPAIYKDADASYMDLHFGKDIKMFSTDWARNLDEHFPGRFRVHHSDGRRADYIFLKSNRDDSVGYLKITEDGQVGFSPAHPKSEELRKGMEDLTTGTGSRDVHSDELYEFLDSNQFIDFTMHAGKEYFKIPGESQYEFWIHPKDIQLRITDSNGPYDIIFSFLGSASTTELEKIPGTDMRVTFDQALEKAPIKMFTADWFQDLSSFDPGVFFIDGKKYLYTQQSDKDGILIFTLGPEGRLIAGPLGTKLKESQELIEEIKMTQRPGGNRYLFMGIGSYPLRQNTSGIKLVLAQGVGIIAHVVGTPYFGYEGFKYRVMGDHIRLKRDKFPDEEPSIFRLPELEQTIPEWKHPKFSKEWFEEDLTLDHPQVFQFVDGQGEIQKAAFLPLETQKDPVEMFKNGVLIFQRGGRLYFFIVEENNVKGGDRAAGIIRNLLKDNIYEAKKKVLNDEIFQQYFSKAGPTASPLTHFTESVSYEGLRFTTVGDGQDQKLAIKINAQGRDAERIYSMASPAQHPFSISWQMYDTAWFEKYEDDGVFYLDGKKFIYLNVHPYGNFAILTLDQHGVVNFGTLLNDDLKVIKAIRQTQVASAETGLSVEVEYPIAAVMPKAENLRVYFTVPGSDPNPVYFTPLREDGFHYSDTLVHVVGNKLVSADNKPPMTTTYEYRLPDNNAEKLSLDWSFNQLGDEPYSLLLDNGKLKVFVLESAKSHDLIVVYPSLESPELFATVFHKDKDRDIIDRIKTRLQAANTKNAGRKKRKRGEKESVQALEGDFELYESILSHKPLTHITVNGVPVSSDQPLLLSDASESDKHINQMLFVHGNGKLSYQTAGESGVTKTSFTLVRKIQDSHAKRKRPKKVARRPKVETKAPPKPERDPDLVRAVEVFNTVKEQHSQPLVSIPIIGVGRGFGQRFQAASGPIPIWIEVTINSDRGLEQAIQLGVKAIKDLARKEVPSDTTVSIWWGDNEVPFVYRVGKNPKTRDLHLQPMGDVPSGEVVLKRNGGATLELDRESEFFRGLEAKVYGRQKIAMELTGPKNKITGFMISGDGDVELKLLEKIRGFTEGSGATVKIGRDKVSWTITFSYSDSQKKALLKLIETVTEMFQDSFEFNQELNWPKPVVVAAKPAPKPAPKKKAKGPETEKFSKTVDLHGRVLNGRPELRFHFEKVTSPKGEVISVNMTKVIFRGEELTNLDLPFDVTTIAEEESHHIQVSRRVQYRSKDGLKVEEGFEQIEIHIHHDLNVEVIKDALASIDELAAVHTAATKVLTNEGAFEDIYQVSLSVMPHPETGETYVYKAQIQLNIPEPVLERLGLASEQEFYFDDPMDWKMLLDKGDDLIVEYPGLGVLAFELSYDHESGQIIATREPMESIHTIETSKNSVSLGTMMEELLVEIPIEPVDLKRSVPALIHERWFRIVADEKFSEQDNIQVLAYLQRLAGESVETEVGPQMGMAILGFRPDVKDSRIEIQIHSFERHPDAPDPVISKSLNRYEYEMLLRAIFGPERVGASSDLSVTIAENPSLTTAEEAWGIQPGDVFLPTVETLKKIEELFYDVRTRGRMFRQKRLNVPLEFINGQGRVISVPVMLRRRKTNVFVLDENKPITMYNRGHREETQQDVSENWFAYDQGGSWLMYPLNPDEDNRVKPFNLKIVIHPDSPAIATLVNVYDENGSPDQEEEFIEKAEKKLVRHVHGVFQADVTDMPPIYTLQKQLSFPQGKPVQLKFVADATSESFEEVEISGFQLRGNYKRLDFDQILTMTITRSNGVGPVTNVIRLRQTKSPDDTELIILTEMTDEGAMRFVWDLDQGIIMPLSSDDLTIDRAWLKEELKRRGLPSTGDEHQAFGGPRKKYQVRFQDDAKLHFDTSIPLLDETDQSFVIPSDENIEGLKDPAQVIAILAELEEDGISLHDEILLPTEETIWAQTYIGRDVEFMTFVTRSGVIVQIPMKAVRSGRSTMYRNSQEVDPDFGVMGARVLIPRSDLPDQYYELENIILHQHGYDFQLAIYGEDKQWQKQELFEFKRVTARAGISHKTGFGFHVVEKGASAKVHKEEASQEIKAWMQMLNLHQTPLSSASIGEKLRLGDHQLGLTIIQTGDEENPVYELEGVEIKKDNVTGALQAFVEYEVIDGSGEAIDLGQMEILRAPDDSSLFFLKDSDSKQLYPLIVSSEGSLFLWERHKNLPEFFQPATSSNFFTVGIKGEKYGTRLRMTEDVDRVQDKKKKDQSLVPRATAMRLNLSEKNDPVQRFEVHVAAGRWIPANRAALLLGLVQDEAQFKFHIQVEETGELSAQAIALEGLAAESESFPWNENFHVELVEDTWQDSQGQTHYGRIRLIFWHEAIVGGTKKKVNKIPYGWIEFENRDKLVGDKRDFQVQLSHYSFEFKYKDRKLRPHQEGYLTKREGVKFNGADFDYSLKTAQGDVPLSEDLFSGMELMGRSALELLGQTQARQTDIPILLGALHLLDEQHPDWKLFEQNGSYEENLSRLAAFAAVKLGHRDPKSIFWIKGALAKPPELFEEKPEEEAIPDVPERVKEPEQPVESDQLDLSDQSEEIDEVIPVSSARRANESLPKPEKIPEPRVRVRKRAKPIEVTTVSSSDFTFRILDYRQLLTVLIKDFKKQENTVVLHETTEEYSHTEFVVYDHIIDGFLKIHFYIDRKTGKNLMLIDHPAHSSFQGDDFAKMRWRRRNGQRLKRRLDQAIAKGDPYFMRHIHEIRFTYNIDGDRWAANSFVRDASGNYVSVGEEVVGAGQDIIQPYSAKIIGLEEKDTKKKESPASTAPSGIASALPQSVGSDIQGTVTTGPETKLVNPDHTPETNSIQSSPWYGSQSHADFIMMQPQSYFENFKVEQLPQLDMAESWWDEPPVAANNTKYFDSPHRTVQRSPFQTNLVNPVMVNRVTTSSNLISFSARKFLMR